jgi:2-hydroxychromene-2-carboxylate isomerase
VLLFHWPAYGATGYGIQKRMSVFGGLQADTVAAVWIAAAAIHREKNTVEAAAAAGLQPQQAAANKANASVCSALNKCTTPMTL